jgi:hypothetical protein
MNISEGFLQFSTITEVLEDMRSVNLGAALIGQKGKIIAIAYTVDMRARQSIKDKPALALLPPADVKINSIGRRRNS